MISKWEGVDSLIRELGAVRRAADASHASETASAAVETAIADAAEAIGVTISAPQNDEALSRARDTIRTARELVGALTTEIDRGRRARQHAADLGVVPPPRRDR